MRTEAQNSSETEEIYSASRRDRSIQKDIDQSNEEFSNNSGTKDV